MEDTKSLRELVKNKPFLFWYIKDIGKLSRESIVEAILTRGDFDDLLGLINVLGINKVSQIFFKQISINRKNYNKKTENYFRLFFDKHKNHV